MFTIYTMVDPEIIASSLRTISTYYMSPLIQILSILILLYPIYWLKKNKPNQYSKNIMRGICIAISFVLFFTNADIKVQNIHNKESFTIVYKLPFAFAAPISYLSKFGYTAQLLEDDQTSKEHPNFIPFSKTGMALQAQIMEKLVNPEIQNYGLAFEISTLFQNYTDLQIKKNILNPTLVANSLDLRNLLKINADLQETLNIETLIYLIFLYDYFSVHTHLTYEEFLVSIQQTLGLIANKPSEKDIALIIQQFFIINILNHNINNFNINNSGLERAYNPLTKKENYVLSPLEKIILQNFLPLTEAMKSILYCILAITMLIQPPLFIKQKPFISIYIPFITLISLEFLRIFIAHTNKEQSIQWIHALKNLPLTINNLDQIISVYSQTTYLHPILLGLVFIIPLFFYSTLMAWVRFSRLFARLKRQNTYPLTARHK